MDSSSAPTVTRVLRLRIKDKHVSWLSAQAREVNFVWNFCNELSVRVFERERRFIGVYELQKFTDGATKEGLGLHSHTVLEVGQENCRRRRQFHKAKLRWRVSGGARRSLGWVPFKTGALKYANGQVRFNGQTLSLWDSYGLSRYDLRAGNFSEDARGRWHLNVSVQVPLKLGPPAGQTEVGIDLGLKDLFATSDGQQVDAPQFYRDLEPRLAAAQRAGKKKRVRVLQAKIANRRKDFLHKYSTALVEKHRAIFVGNVNAAALAQTRAAKSVLDAGWSTFRTMLQYKCDSAGVWFKEVDEAYSTQDCHVCRSRNGRDLRRKLFGPHHHWLCRHLTAGFHHGCMVSCHLLPHPCFLRFCLFGCTCFLNDVPVRAREDGQGCDERRRASGGQDNLSHDSSPFTSNSADQNHFVQWLAGTAEYKVVLWGTTSLHSRWDRQTMPLQAKR
ncbi:transposase [Cupriavidus sp. CV2]|uniref:RNA-guided endonuclease InsQ/TnpB family protein n=1 Tax=Cupriavidus ulmosensis TaxID=3065913 RepID=UPI00296B09F9|nr:transposase [Cupriavidus sp. CV2]MDW3686542.1 transposase [Cupriavidus sp. CV2]